MRIKTIFTLGALSAIALAAPAVYASGTEATSAASQSQKKYMPLVHEALVEDGIGSTWKFYLYGETATSDSGEMGYTYGTSRYNGYWTTTTINGRTAYELTFDDSKVANFNDADENEVPLSKAAIVDNGNGSGYFIVYPSDTRYNCEIEQ